MIKSEKQKIHDKDAKHQLNTNKVIKWIMIIALAIIIICSVLGISLTVIL